MNHSLKVLMHAYIDLVAAVNEITNPIISRFGFYLPIKIAALVDPDTRRQVHECRDLIEDTCAASTEMNLRMLTHAYEAIHDCVDQESIKPGLQYFSRVPHMLEEMMGLGAHLAKEVEELHEQVSH